MTDAETRAVDHPERLIVEGVPFVCSDGFRHYTDDTDPDVLTLVKTPAMVERLRQLVPAEPGARVVELGIAFGGSVALLSLLARPSKLVALELSPEPLERLAGFIARRGLGSTVKPYYGIDQADRAALVGVVEAEFASVPLDLVVDDASHLYGPTRASFECLFPRLRPGGTYLIEDWSWQHHFAAALRRSVGDGQTVAGAELAARMERGQPVDHEPPLSRLATELLLLVAEEGDVVGSVSVDPDWIVVTRGQAELDPTTFRLDAVLVDHFATITPR